MHVCNFGQTLIRLNTTMCSHEFWWATSSSLAFGTSSILKRSLLRCVKFCTQKTFDPSCWKRRTKQKRTSLRFGWRKANHFKSGFITSQTRRPLTSSTCSRMIRCSSSSGSITPSKGMKPKTLKNVSPNTKNVIASSRLCVAVRTLMTISNTEV